MSKDVYGEILRLPSIKALWRFNNNSNDELGVNNGSDSNIVYNLGKLKYYASFNGSNSRIAITDTTDTQPDGVDWSIGFWRRGVAVGGSIISLLAKAITLDGILIEESATSLRCFIHDTALTSSLSMSFSTNPKINDGNWRFIVWTFNFTTRTMRGYVDGKQRVSGTFSFTPNFISPARPTIGARWNDNLNDYFTYWAGDLEEAFLLNGYELQSGEIRHLFAQTKGQHV